MDRRDFIKYVVAGSVAAGCPFDLALAEAQTQGEPKIEGESNTICHQVRDGKTFSRPAASAKHDVVIVGGGVSGLSAAYLLRKDDFLLLEKEPHWGGNAYAMEYDGMLYGTGSAFILDDEEHAWNLAKEIGLELLPTKIGDATIVNGKWVADCWGDGIDDLPYPASVREGFKKFRQEIVAIDLEKRTQELFKRPFSDLLKGYPEELTQWWDCYGTSTYGAVCAEAAAGIGVSEAQDVFHESRKDDRYTCPGGLAGFTRKLSEILTAQSPERMQSGATVVSVVPGKEDVQVTYMLGAELKTVSAKAVIMASPKFITRRIVEGLPEKQDEAMGKIRYVPYAVVNLIFDKPVYNRGFDTWCPGTAYTDVLVADWVLQKNKPGYKQKHNILTLYAPLFEEQRPALLTDAGTKKVGAKVLRDFQKALPEFNVDPVEVHIYRRGHPMYMTTPGLYTDVQPLARAPMDRVFFANTDSEGPESTTNEGIAAAKRAVKEMEQRLAGKPVPQT
jgi:protoporphyrinogen oxidase